MITLECYWDSSHEFKVKDKYFYYKLCPDCYNGVYIKLLENGSIDSFQEFLWRFYQLKRDSLEVYLNHLNPEQREAIFTSKFNIFNYSPHPKLDYIKVVEIKPSFDTPNDDEDE